MDGPRGGAAELRAAAGRAQQGGGRLNAPVLVLPGLGDSGPDHWQSHWERRDRQCRRVIQDEWHAPGCASWVERLAATLATIDQPVVLAAHSAGCAMIAHWVVRAAARAGIAGPGETHKVLGALLVAPSDPAGPNYPSGPTGFAPVPLVRLPFPSIVVASDRDPYVSPGRAREYAAAWGSRLVMLPDAGHINVASGHGAWPEGFELLATLRRAAGEVAA